jgi:hypothetical protein
VSAFAAALTALGEWLLNTAIPAVVQFFLDLPGNIFDALATLGQTLLDVFTSAMEGARDVVSNLITEIVDFFRNLPGTIALLGFAIADAALGIGQAIIGGIISGLTGAGEAIGDAASSILDGIGNIVDGIREGIGKAIDNLIPNEIAKVEIEIAGRKVTIVPGIPLPDNPLKSAGFYAGGGIFDRPTAGIFGEAGKEVLIPLTNPARAAQLARESGLLELLAKQQQVSASGTTLVGPAGAGLVVQNLTIRANDVQEAWRETNTELRALARSARRAP